VTRDEIRLAIGSFIALLQDRVLDDDEASQTLPLLLDTLASASRWFPDSGLEYVTAPITPYDERRQLAAERFPGLGLYNTVPIAPVGDAEPEVGDAIDDLADIYGDLEVFDQLWTTDGPEAAMLAVSATFDAHWGAHLRDLQHYLFYCGA